MPRPRDRSALAVSLAVVVLSAGCGDRERRPTITMHPSDQAAAEGETATFTVWATGSGTLSYQWQRSDDGGSTWQSIDGATSASYTTPPATPADDGATFRCVVSNRAGSVVSGVAALVMTLPAIATQPSDQTVTEGESVAFTVEAAGSGTLTYQWRRSDDGGSTWSDVPGATSPTCSFTTALSDDGAVFMCAVTNALGSVESSTATLTVNMAPPSITVQPSNQSVVSTETATFTVAATGSGSISLQWRRSDDGGSTWDDIIGATDTSYTTPATTLADDGALFLCVVSNKAGSVESNVAGLVVDLPTYVIVDLTTGGVSGVRTVSDLLTNDTYKTTALVLKLIPAGTLQMGDQTGAGEADELPVHTVNITRDLYVGVFEITVEQWDEVQGYFLSSQYGGKHPVVGFSWNDIRGAGGFTETLSSTAGMIFVLPSEAEWEYACKAGTSTNYSYGNTASGSCMWTWENSDTGVGHRPQEVGTRLPNPWGLYDMHGNVYEWCQDWYDEGYYQFCVDNAITDDPIGPPSGTYRVDRGGSWNMDAVQSRSSNRARLEPDARLLTDGFRVVMTTDGL